MKIFKDEIDLLEFLWSFVDDKDIDKTKVSIYYNIKTDIIAPIDKTFFTDEIRSNYIYLGEY